MGEFCGVIPKKVTECHTYTVWKSMSAKKFSHVFPKRMERLAPLSSLQIHAASGHSLVWESPKGQNIGMLTYENTWKYPQIWRHLSALSFDPQVGMSKLATCGSDHSLFWGYGQQLWLTACMFWRLRPRYAKHPAVMSAYHIGIYRHISATSDSWGRKLMNKQDGTLLSRWRWENSDSLLLN